MSYSSVKVILLIAARHNKLMGDIAAYKWCSIIFNGMGKRHLQYFALSCDKGLETIIVCHWIYASG
jgi:hypothetical protein